MKPYIPFFAAGLLLTTACDKISADQYVNHNGSGSSSWVDPYQHAFVEKYTGPSCTFCPLADQTLTAAHERFGDRLIIVSVNDCYTSQGSPLRGQPDLRTEEGGEWEAYAIGTTPGIPSALVGRNRDTRYESAMANIVPAIEEVLSQSATVAVEASARQVADSISIDVSVRFIQQYTSPLTLTLVLTEDSMVYFQKLPNTKTDSNYVHNHMLRDVITPVWGMDIEASGASGEVRRTTVGYKAYSGLVPMPVLTNCHIVAIVSDRATRRVLNAVQVPVE